MTQTIWHPNPTGKERVWGCARPELLISETLAFHDRRTQDTSDEDASTIAKDNKDNDQQTSPGTTTESDKDKKDGSFDQTYRPQGSLFVEVYNPSSKWAPPSGDLYSYSATKQQWVVSLAQLSGTASTGAVGANKPSPVWRMLIASSFKGTATGGGNGSGSGVPVNPSGGTSPSVLDPDDPDQTKWPTIDREVYFVPLDPTKMTVPLITDGGTSTKVQFSPSTLPVDAGIPAGGYAVIGPGELQQTYQNGHPNRTYLGFRTGQTAGDDQTRYIELTPGASTVTQAAAGSASLPALQANNSTPDPANLATSVNTPVMLPINTPGRLSVSEPYKPGATPPNIYDQYESKLAAATKDSSGRYMNAGKPTAFDVPFEQQRALDYPKDPDNISLQTNQTVPAFRMIYLQRLANPLKPYDKQVTLPNGTPNPNYNPYRTVDCMAVDLTVFNGLTDTKDPVAGDNSKIDHFEARQRGEHNEGDLVSGLNQQMDLWKQEPVDKSYTSTTTPPQATGHYFTVGLKHSLGYLNQPFGAPEANAVTGERGMLAGTTTAQNGTFPWLAWNNRPYISPFELTSVPWLSSSQLLGQYAVAGTATTGKSPYENYGVPFPHLMNLFPSGAPGTLDEELHRLLEYLTVPSPYVGTEIWTNPTSSVNGNHPYHPPFNCISNYREPGRINLNTIYDQNVFNALTAGAGTDTNAVKPTWDDFKKSRSGSTGTGILDMPAANSPTEFAHPFRSFAGATMIPTLPGDPLKPKREIDVTLMRENSTDGLPLFRVSSTAPTACDNTDRNPSFYYQGLQRLSNMVTTRSNVFAVWITVGYFEVQPAPTTGKKHATGTAWTAAEYQLVYPDGYQLGAELGIDTGQLVRHRAFYIIDRTLPVGFQRGKDLNTDKAILVNRFIE
jgi:hypothetical protein